ncbi:MAG: tRNA (N(6)-L-threonylcarbamoyladenosine(37)-C(2))-methylthiotransferase MtaB [Spirochaetota bacterium]
MTVAIKTFGCKLNQYESEALISRLVALGHAVAEGDDADVLIVNSCTVTKKSDAKLRQYMNNARLARSYRLIIVTGCYASIHRDESMGDALIIPNEQKDAIPVYIDHFSKHGVLPDAADDTYESITADDYQFHSRAFLKIQDGCDAFCNYCIVAHARGVPRSTPHEAVLDMVRRLVDDGFGEIVFTGINIGAYKHGDVTLTALIERVLPVLGPSRLRISSIEPLSIDEGFIKLMAHPSICRHLHIPLQSACDSVLMRMKRRYTAAEYRAVIEKLYRIDGHLSITTDVMAGHPFESGGDAKATYDFCKEMRFAKLHVFRYSVREGTPSAQMPQLPDREKSERARTLAALDIELRRNFRESLIGRETAVAVETKGQGYFEGLASEYMHCTVLTAEDHPERSLVPVRYVRVNGETMMCEPL